MSLALVERSGPVISKLIDHLNPLNEGKISSSSSSSDQEEHTHKDWHITPKSLKRRRHRRRKTKPALGGETGAEIISEKTENGNDSVNKQTSLSILARIKALLGRFF
jgi:hypothetical protein